MFHNQQRSLSGYGYVSQMERVRDVMSDAMCDAWWVMVCVVICDDMNEKNRHMVCVS